MSIIGILKIMEVQEDDMEVQEEAVLKKMQDSNDHCERIDYLSVETCYHYL